MCFKVYISLKARTLLLEHMSIAQAASVFNVDYTDMYRYVIGLVDIPMDLVFQIFDYLNVKLTVNNG